MVQKQGQKDRQKRSNRQGQRLVQVQNRQRNQRKCRQHLRQRDTAVRKREGRKRRRKGRFWLGNAWSPRLGRKRSIRLNGIQRVNPPPYFVKNRVANRPDFLLPPPTMANRTAQQLHVSDRALDLCLDADFIDLHIDTLIPQRLWGYDVFKRHGLGLLRGHFFGHLDLPRMTEQGVKGAMWSLTTNPLRPQNQRWQVLQKNRLMLENLVTQSRGQLQIARDVHEYQQARAAGAHAVLPAIQGGHALAGAENLDAWLADRWLTRVTVVHLVDSVYGATSSPLAWHKARKLREEGRRVIEALDRARVFVDLAHIAAPAFWDAVEAHDPALPLIATHTGVTGVRPHWRNLDDAQLEAIGQSGGVVGVIYAANFMGRPQGPKDCHMVAEHLEHIAKVAGEHVPAIGSDYDGAIVPPPDMRDGMGHVRLVDALLTRGWGESQVRNVLGGNFLRSWAKLRP